MRRWLRLIDVAMLCCLGGIALVLHTGGVRGPGFSVTDVRRPAVLFAALLALRLVLCLPRLWRQARRRARLLLLLAVVGLTALVPRTWDLKANSLNVDETLWMSRGLKTADAVAQERWIDATAHLSHPGVVQSLLIGLSQRRLGRDMSPTSLGWLDRLAAARLPIALLGTATCVLLAALGSAIWGAAVAVAAGLFLALDPVHIALSRVAHVDAVLALFCMLTVLCYALGVERRDWRWKVAAGLFFGCALLSKAPAFVLPAVLLLWRTAVWIRDRRPLRTWLVPSDALCVLLGFCVYLVCFTRLSLGAESHRAFLKSGKGYWGYEGLHAATSFLADVPLVEFLLAAFVLLRLACWWRSGPKRNWQTLLLPTQARWGWLLVGMLLLLLFRIFPKHLEMISVLLRRFTGMATSSREVSEAVHVKGAYNRSLLYYPFILAVRSTPMLVLCASLGGFGAAWRYFALRREAAGTALAWTGLFSFVLFMSFASRQAIRYVLPSTPFLCVLGGYGAWFLARAVNRLTARYRPRPALVTAGIGVLMAGLHIPLLVRFFPDYYLYFNAFIGGPSGAAERVVVGWGEGYKEAVRFLKQDATPERPNISALGECALLRYYWHYGEPEPTFKAQIATRVFDEADYLVVILNKLQRLPGNRMADFARQHRPVHVVRKHGVELAGIYRHSRRPVRGRTTFSAANRALDATTGRHERDPRRSGKRARAARADRDKPGYLVHGPYRTYAPGRYEAVFDLRVGPVTSPDAAVARLDVVLEGGNPVLAQRQLLASDFAESGRYTQFSLPFEVEQAQPLEFRVYFEGAADLWFHEVRTQPFGTERKSYKPWRERDARRSRRSG